MRSERKKQGLEVIDLSIGAPNIPPTQEVMETIAKGSYETRELSLCD